MSGQWIPLSDLGRGQCGIVRELSGGRRFVGRLASLGFSTGVPVQILQNTGHGPLLVLVRDTRVALGRGEAVKIRISEKGPAND